MNEKYNRYVESLTTSATDGLTAGEITKFKEIIKNAMNVHCKSVFTVLMLDSFAFTCRDRRCTTCADCDNCGEDFCPNELARKLEDAILGKEDENGNK